MKKKLLFIFFIAAIQIQCLTLDEAIEKGLKNSKQINVSETEKYIDKLLVKKKPNKPKWTFTAKRLYINNINRTLETMKKSGIEFISEKHEENGYLEYIIRIPHD